MYLVQISRGGQHKNQQNSVMNDSVIEWKQQNALGDFEDPKQSESS